MSSDRARVSYDANQQYRAVVAQQGRVTLEADWNEAQQIANEELREEVLDFVGPSGTPDDGYKIDQSLDFTVSAGTMYVGGIRVFLTDSIKYSSQLDWLDRIGDPDWVEPGKVGNGNLQPELVYLYLREQEISAVEDSALQEVALGGPDTTQRTRLIQHIVRLSTKGRTCQTALEEAIEHWRNQGLNFNPETMRLESFAKLQVSFSSQPPPADPCNPETKGGYLGAENQLIRVQISGIDTATGQAKLLWGFDNASFLYRVDVTKNPTLKLQSSPVDDFHRPRVGQAVEVLRSAAQLSNGEYIASATGRVYTLAAPYNPDTQEVTLPGTLPSEYENSEQTPRVFLRVWEEQEKPFTPGTAIKLGNTGLQVTLQISGQPFHVGDYWLFAVRPTTPAQIYPQRYLDLQPPDGPRLWVCPLGVISRNSDFANVEDCRQHFDDLVKLTKRQAGGCCTVIVKPEDLREGITLQSIVDRFSNRDRVTICLMPGIYRLPRSLQLGAQHSNLTLEGCHDGAELQAEPGRESEFLHGLVVLNRANSVTLRNLRFQLPIIPFVKAGGELTPFPGFRGFGKSFQDNLRVSIGIRPLHSALLTVENCLFRFVVEKTISLFAVGIFASSECWGLKLIKNQFLRDEEYLLVEQKTEQNEQRFLVGYLLAPALIPTKGANNSTQEVNEFSIVPSLLQDAIIYDNRFTGLTTATLILADTGSVRIENNTVIQCISGFWLTPIELGEILGTNRQTGILSFVFPLPPFFDVSELAHKFADSIDNIPGIDRLSLSLHVMSNDIDAGIVEQSVALSGPGLVIGGNKRLNRTNRDRSTTSSVILTANKIRRGKSLIFAFEFPKEENRREVEKAEEIGFARLDQPLNRIDLYSSNYTVLIDSVERCTVTGNLIFNESTEREKKSLVIPFDQQTKAIAAIAITGNVFQGEPDLPDRSNIGTNVPSPMNTWNFLNTVIA
ncbi:DUF6519 domain-containing protein [Nostoc sp.]|uniref:DUF6519 domain-containing protein n=1 Tax=Nostoc sp. TaxID=1180 RepID=UPI002FFC46FE